MVKSVFWIGGLGKVLILTPALCLDVGIGVICGVAQGLKIGLYSKNSINEAINFQQAANACQDELPNEILHDQVHELMEEGGKDAVIKAKALLTSGGISKQCIEIFGLVCTKAEEFGALDLIKEACMNLWV